MAKSNKQNVLDGLFFSKLMDRSRPLGQMAGTSVLKHSANTYLQVQLNKFEYL